VINAAWYNTVAIHLLPRNSGDSLAEGQDLDAVTRGVALGSGVDDKTPHRSDVPHSPEESLFDFWSGRPFDFEGKGGLSRALDHQSISATSAVR
jgi:hypothetical protein